MRKLIGKIIKWYLGYSPVRPYSNMVIDSKTMKTKVLKSSLVFGFNEGVDKIYIRDALAFKMLDDFKSRLSIEILTKQNLGEITYEAIASICIVEVE